MLYVNIKKEFDNFKLDIEFETNGETMALLGASGCGKSMTLKCIAGIEKPDEGEIILNNRILFNSKKKINLLPQNRKVGLLFQSYALFPNMTLRQNIAIAVPKGRNNKNEIINEKIEAFSLKGLENNYPHQLSGGQQQRVALARMLVNEPEILMLDEPFSALDEHLRWQMEQEIISILRTYGGNTLYVSHNKDEVFRICEKVAVFNKGKIEEINSREEIFNRPTTYAAAVLTGCKNISKAKKISENKVCAVDLGLELNCNEVDDDVKYVGIYTEHLKVSEDNKEENTFEFNILNVIDNLFSHTLVLSPRIKDYETQKIYMEVSESQFKGIENKKSIYLHFNKKNLLLLNK
ncbi:ATP-binding cassette domain-containing protein [Tissierella pigra]|nr:ATP-binding cassette domain-containing protein [Tissierella pigra]